MTVSFITCVVLKPWRAGEVEEGGLGGERLRDTRLLPLLPSTPTSIAVNKREKKSNRSPVGEREIVWACKEKKKGLLSEEAGPHAKEVGNLGMWERKEEK